MKKVKSFSSIDRWACDTCGNSGPKELIEICERLHCKESTATVADVLEDIFDDSICGFIDWDKIDKSRNIDKTVIVTLKAYHRALMNVLMDHTHRIAPTKNWRHSEGMTLPNKE